MKFYTLDKFFVTYRIRNGSVFVYTVHEESCPERHNKSKYINTHGFPKEFSKLRDACNYMHDNGEVELCKQCYEIRRMLKIMQTKREQENVCV